MVGGEQEPFSRDPRLFLAGAITAAEYFGGEIGPLVDRLIAETNWRAYATSPEGYLSMGWKPDDPGNLDGPGKFLDWHWWNIGWDLEDPLLVFENDHHSLLIEFSNNLTLVYVELTEGLTWYADTGRN